MRMKSFRLSGIATAILLTTSPTFAVDQGETTNTAETVTKKKNIAGSDSTSVYEIYDQDAVRLDNLAITSSRDARPTKEISQSIGVIDERQIDEYNPQNITQILKDIPGVLAETSSGGYSTRLFIRGSGVRAPFAVREIVVLRDGIPITDPDSLSRFDFIDTQDIQQLEVTKGPGSIYSQGSTGGVIQILSKSVFDPSDSRIKAGYGTYNTYNVNGRFATQFGDSDFVAATLSRRESGSNWRENNHFHTEQVSVKYGHIFDDESKFETEVSYTEARLDLPARLNEAEFDEFKDTGEQRDGVYRWQDSSRDSNIVFANFKYTKEFDDFVFTPRAYLNYWDQWHPVTSQIVDSPDNLTLGIDLEGKWHHQLFGNDATLIVGGTIRHDESNDAKRWTYKDVATSFTRFPFPHTQIDRTLSDRKGDLMAEIDEETTLYGAYIQETFKPVDALTIDMSFRFDQIRIEIDRFEHLDYNFGLNRYEPGNGAFGLNETYDVISGRFGASYAINDLFSTYFNFGYGEQVPSTTEVQSNIELGFGGLIAAESFNYEVGVKGRGEHFTVDMSFFYNPVENEIVQVRQDTETVFQNAGKTEKLGFEFSGELEILPDHVPGLWLGANYAFSDFYFVEFSEVEGFGRGATTVDRSGNQFPKVPKHYYTLSARYDHPSGVYGAIRTRSWGSYYIDNDNSKGKYEGFDFVTDLTLGFRHQGHSIQGNIYNLFDKHYAAAVSDSSTPYRVAAPFTAMVTYQYDFEI